MPIVYSGFEFNKKYPDGKFFKLTNEKENHNGFQFKTGLNVDTQTLNSEITCGNGIYFCYFYSVRKWFKYGGTEMVYIRKVTIPENANVVEYTVDKKLKSDRLILGKPRLIIDIPSLRVKILQKLPNQIRFLSNQTDEICLEAVKNSGIALEFVTKQTDEICLEAVKNYGFALKFVKNQTDEICIEAVKNNGLALEFVTKQTDEICLEAVKNIASALEFVTNQTDEICREVEYYRTKTVYRYNTRYNLRNISRINYCEKDI